MADLGPQFARMTFTGVGQRRETRYASVPKVEEGKTRLWRATSFPQLSSGYWADQPRPAYGDSMLYMDLDHEEAERHKTATRGTYVVPAEGKGKPMPGRVNVVKYEDRP